MTPLGEEALNRWPDISNEYAAWLRTFPMLVKISLPGDLPEISGKSEPVCQDTTFWLSRTLEAESFARKHLNDREIDGIFEDVAAIIDENLSRFDPLVAYFGRYLPDGDPQRIDAEREVAHCVKRDLAWAAIERAIGEPGFFCTLVAWYDCGRWPYGWAGEYPAGHLRVL